MTPRKSNLGMVDARDQAILDMEDAVRSVDGKAFAAERAARAAKSDVQSLQAEIDDLKDDFVQARAIMHDTVSCCVNPCDPVSGRSQARTPFNSGRARANRRVYIGEKSVYIEEKSVYIGEKACT